MLLYGYTAFCFLFIIWWLFGLYLPYSTGNSAAMNFTYKVLFEHLFLIPLAYTSEWVCWVICYFFTLWGTAKLYSTVTVSPCILSSDVDFWVLEVETRVFTLSYTYSHLKIFFWLSHCVVQTGPALVVLLSQPPSVLELQVCATIPVWSFVVLSTTVFSF